MPDQLSGKIVFLECYSSITSCQIKRLCGGTVSYYLPQRGAKTQSILFYITTEFLQKPSKSPSEYMGCDSIRLKILENMITAIHYTKNLSSPEVVY